MKVCIVSDSHDRTELLEAAVREAVAAGARAVLHCGDVVKPETLKVIMPFDLPVYVIHGNNSGNLAMMSRIASEESSNLHYYGHDAGFELAGRRIYLVHFPDYANSMSTTGEWDLVCCGHSHRAAVSAVENRVGTLTHLVNPGTVGGIGAPATWVLGDLEAMTFSIFEVPGSMSARQETA